MCIKLLLISKMTSVLNCYEKSRKHSEQTNSQVWIKAKFLTIMIYVYITIVHITYKINRGLIHATNWTNQLKTE